MEAGEENKENLRVYTGFRNHVSNAKENVT